MAETKVVRLKVNPAHGTLLVELGVSADPKTGKRIPGYFKRFKAGEVFDHPEPEAAKRLLDIRPSIVTETTDKTKEELAADKLKAEVAKGVVGAQMLKQVDAFMLNREKRLKELAEKLRKQKPEEVLAEAKRRGLEFPGDKPPMEDVFKEIVEDEAKEIDKLLQIQA